MNRPLALAVVLSLTALSQTVVAKGPAIKPADYFLSISGDVVQVGAPVRVADGEQIYAGSDGRQHSASEIENGFVKVRVSASTDFLIQGQPSAHRDEPLKIQVQKIRTVITNLDGKVIGYKVAADKSDVVVQVRNLPKTSTTTISAEHLNEFFRSPRPGLVDFSWHTLNSMLNDKNPASEKALVEFIKSAQSRPNYAKTKLGRFYALMLAEKTKNLPEFQDVYQLVKDARWNQKLTAIDTRSGVTPEDIVSEVRESAEAGR